MEKLNLKSLGTSKRSGRPHQLKFCCPFCNEDKFRFSVNTKKGIYHCYRCGVGGRVEKLETPLDSFRDKVSKFLKPEPKFVMRKPHAITLPESFITPIKSSSGMPYRYLEKRMITPKEQARYRIGFCNEGDFAERIIIPIYDDGVLVYFVGRAYSSRQPKYLNAPVRKDTIIFKTFEKPVHHAVVVEGIFDALRIGKIYPTIAILGKILTISQAIEIKRYAETVTVVLDPDAKKYAFEIYKQLGYAMPAKIVMLEGRKDPGDLNEREIMKIIPKGVPKIIVEKRLILYRKLKEAKK